MRDSPTFAERLPPDTISRLERASLQRFDTAEFLRTKQRLEALYFYGYSAEIGLSAAFFRRAGFRPNATIDRDTRQRRMAQARQLRTASGEPLMTGDPHPLVGWARFLEWQRLAGGDLSAEDAQRLREAVHKSSIIYRSWRPELRYKTIEVDPERLEEVRRAARWLLDNQGRL